MVLLPVHAIEKLWEFCFLIVGSLQKSLLNNKYVYYLFLFLPISKNVSCDFVLQCYDAKITTFKLIRFIPLKYIKYTGIDDSFDIMQELNF